MVLGSDVVQQGKGVSLMPLIQLRIIGFCVINLQFSMIGAIDPPIFEPTPMSIFLNSSSCSGIVNAFFARFCLVVKKLAETSTVPVNLKMTWI